MLGYVFGVIMAFGAVVALAFGLFNITAAVNAPRQHRPVIAQTVTVETQRHSPVAKEASAARDGNTTRAAGSGACFRSGRSGRVFERRIIQECASPRIDPLLLGLADYASRVEAVSLYQHQSRRGGVFDRKN